MVLSFSWLLPQKWRRRRCTFPGVVYSEDMEIEELMKETKWTLNVPNIDLSFNPQLRDRLAAINKPRPGPEKVPYTFWERMGLAPVHPSRLRPRQYYLPITDFSLYDYDEISPEEKELTARWLSRVFEFNAGTPMGILCGAGCLVLPLHTVYRMPILIGVAVGAVAMEITRSYLAAAEQRQDLDDFIMAKEIWYIKNVETYQLGIPRMPRGMEYKFRDCLDGTGNLKHEPTAEIMNLAVT